MSGGPVFLFPETGEDFVPFGLISHDSEDSAEVELKNDRSRAGNSIVALLPHHIVNETGVKRGVIFQISELGFARNAEFDVPTS